MAKKVEGYRVIGVYSHAFGGAILMMLMSGSG
jgi:hypothetical protein